MPDVPNLAAKRALWYLRNPLKTSANRECRAVLCPIVVDYYSKFPFVRMLNTLTTGAVIKEIQTIFVENRIPEILRCDNGTQFTSFEFQQLAIQYGFEIVTSSPHYSPWTWICSTSSRNDEEVYIEVQTDRRRHRSSPFGTTNNIPESQFSSARWTPQWSNF